MFIIIMDIIILNTCFLAFPRYVVNIHFREMFLNR